MLTTLAGDTEWSLQTPVDRNNSKGFRQLKTKQEQQGGQIRLCGKSNAKKLQKKQWKKKKRGKSIKKPCQKQELKTCKSENAEQNERIVCKANASTKSKFCLPVLRYHSRQQREMNHLQHVEYQISLCKRNADKLKKVKSIKNNH